MKRLKERFLIVFVFILVSLALQGLAASATLTPSSVDLRMKLREYWSDHIIWTRNYLVSATANTEDQTANLNRLMKNQEDLGNAIKPYYGNAAGDELIRLLKEHIGIAGQVVQAAKGNNTKEMTGIQTKWTNNANEIASFLSSANPNWKKQDLQTMMQEHLNLLNQQITSHINKSWVADISAFDRGKDHILAMADVLAEGIQKQFPAKFSN